MVENVKNTWRTEYGGGSEQPQTSLPPTDDILDQYLRRTTTRNGDSFDSFIHGPVVEFNEGADVYSWLKGNCSLSIRQQALDLLSIPATSAEVERVFSSAKLLLTPQRNSLSDERIEYLELLRYWWRNNLISQHR
jgi:hAT family C-terminal dimerisation region